MSISENLKRGTIEMLLLTLLAEEDMYAYQLTQELSLRSQGLFQFQGASMYPALYRMVDKKLISSRKEIVGKRRERVYYHIEPEGLEYLNEISKEYQDMARGILNILNYRKEPVNNEQAESGI